MMKTIKEMISQNKKATSLLALCLVFILGVIGSVSLTANRDEKKAGGETPPAETQRYVSSNPLVWYDGMEYVENAPVDERHTVFSNLVKYEEYLFALVIDNTAEEILADNNLVYADQGTADRNGMLSFDYFPRIFSRAYICLFGKDSTSATEITWELDNHGEIRVSGNDTLGSYQKPGDAPWYERRSEIKYLWVLGNITEIGSFAFADCKALESVRLPNSVTSIADNAFAGCTELKTISVPSSVQSIDNNAFTDSGLSEVKGYNNSEAKQFAMRNHYSFSSLEGAAPILKGDVNGDGRVNIRDVTAIQRHLGMVDAIPNAWLIAADVTGYGITIEDATVLQRYLAEFDNPYRVGNPVAS